MIIEHVSGERWADYVDRNIFKPLGMFASSVDKNVPGLAVPYGRRMPDGTREVLPFVDARGMAAATGVTSNLEDMAKFVSAQFRRGPRGGAQIVSTGSLREMHRVRSVEDNWTSGTGLGFDITRIRDRTYVGHGGGYPGNTTHTLIQLDDKVGVIVLTNTNDSNPSDIARQLMATVGQAVAKVSASKPATVTWNPTWARFAGLYRGRGGDSHVVLLNQKLAIITPNAPNVDTPVALEPLGGGRFRFVAPTGGGTVGEVVRFVEQTGVDALAVNVGQAHLHGRTEVRLDLSRLTSLKQSVPVPLVLHGASSISREDLQAAIRLGVRKINVGSAMKSCYLEALRSSLHRLDGGYNPYEVIGSGLDEDVLTQARVALQGVVEDLMRLFGSAGKG